MRLFSPSADYSLIHFFLPSSLLGQQALNVGRLCTRLEDFQLYLPYVLFVLGTGCFVNTLDCGLVWDDQAAIEGNRDLREDRPWSSLFQNDFWGENLQSDTSHKSFRPFTVATFRLNYAVHGLRPGGYHLVNAVLHGLACSLFSFCCQRLCASTTHTKVVSDLTVTLASLLFAVHPVHCDSVASVVGRADVLSAVFVMCGLIFYQHAIETCKKDVQHCHDSNHALSHDGSGTSEKRGLQSTSPKNALREMDRMHCSHNQVARAHHVASADEANKCKGENVRLRRTDSCAHTDCISRSKKNTAAPKSLALTGLLASGSGIVRQWSQSLAVLQLAMGKTVAGRISFLFSILCWVAATLSKETGFVVVAMYGAIDLVLVRTGAQRFRIAATRVVILGFLCGFFLILRVSLNGNRSVYNWTLLENHIAILPSRMERILSLGYVHYFYLSLLFLPTSLCYDWGFNAIPAVISFTDIRNVYTVAAYTLVLVTLCRSWMAKDRTLLMGICIGALGFLPASHVFVPVGAVVAERLLYIPSIGFCLVAGNTLSRVLLLALKSTEQHSGTHSSSATICSSAPSPASRPSQTYSEVAVGRRAPSAIAIFAIRRKSVRLHLPVLLLTMYSTIFVCLTCKTLLRNRDWFSNHTLFKSGYEANPHSLKVMNNLGQELLIDAETALEAEKVLSEAVALYPDYESAHFNLGLAFHLQRKSMNAINHYVKAIAIRPDYAKARAHLGQEYLNLWLSIGDNATVEPAKAAKKEDRVYDLTLTGKNPPDGRTHPAKCRIDDGNHHKAVFETEEKSEGSLLVWATAEIDRAIRQLSPHFNFSVCQTNTSVSDTGLSSGCSMVDSLLNSLEAQRLPENAVDKIGDQASHLFVSQRSGNVVQEMFPEISTEQRETRDKLLSRSAEGFTTVIQRVCIAVSQASAHAPELSPAVFHSRASAGLYLGEYDSAIRFYLIALSSLCARPPSVPVPLSRESEQEASSWNMLSVALSKQGISRELTKDFMGLGVQLYPFSVELRANLAGQLTELGLFAEAIREYEAIMSVTEDDNISPLILSNMGFTYERMENLDEAETMYRRALRDGAEHPQILNNLKNLLEWKERTQKGNTTKVTTTV